MLRLVDSFQVDGRNIGTFEYLDVKAICLVVIVDVQTKYRPDPVTSPLNSDSTVLCVFNLSLRNRSSTLLDQNAQVHDVESHYWSMQLWPARIYHTQTNRNELMPLVIFTWSTFEPNWSQTALIAVNGLVRCKLQGFLMINTYYIEADRWSEAFCALVREDRRYKDQ